MLDHPLAAAQAVDVAQLWQALADGLSVQRVYLQRAELLHDTSQDAAALGLPDQVHPPALVGAPRAAGPEAELLLAQVGLLPWVTVPQQLGHSPTDAGVLAATAERIATRVAGGLAADSLPAAIRAVCAASAWWVGAFAVLRRRGVHHLTLSPVTTPVTLEALEQATAAVALGACARVLTFHLQTYGDGGWATRRSYCQVLADTMPVEAALPALLEELGELRLVDLVTDGVPWRGQFTKYRSGLGTGQGE